VKKVLITGSSGFIGSFLVEQSIERGYNTVAGIRSSSSMEYLKETSASLFITDLSDKESIKKNLLEFDRFDYIIHNAGITKTCDKILFDKVNYINTKNLVEALIELDRIPEKFILISSLAAYGPGRNGNIPIKLSDSPLPISIYGESKLKTEKYLKSIKGFPYLIFRPTGVYGPREKDYFVMYQSIKSGLETYVGSREQYISFIYVKDLVQILITSLESNSVRKSYFVSDLKDYTAVEFNEIVKNELGKKTISIVFPKFFVKMIAFLGEKISCLLSRNIPTLNTEKYKDISQRNWLCDSSDLVKDFDFKPDYDLRNGIKETIDWNKKQGLL